MNAMIASSQLLHLLQLASSTLPVGAYSYSEAIESLVACQRISSQLSLEHWLQHELDYGTIRLEAAVMLQGYDAFQRQDLEPLKYWNRWLSATRETEEMRAQSWQMGRSLLRLLYNLYPTGNLQQAWQTLSPHNCNFAIAFGIAAAHWQIDPDATVLGYLHSWATNLISAGIKLIPLGQTAGQQLLLQLHPSIHQAADFALQLPNEELESCSWGMTLASMAHETQYTRLFRS